MMRVRTFCQDDAHLFVLPEQIEDEIGRVISIIPTPNGAPSNICFGGPNFDMMYISVKDKVYRRKVGVKGANSFDKPFKPNTPKI